MPLSQKWRAMSVTGNGVLKHTGERFQYRLGFATGEDAASLVRLQGQILSVAPKPLPLYARDQRYFEACAKESGCIVGAWNGDLLIAYSLLQLPQTGEESCGAVIGIPADELRRVGHAAGSGVHPDYRGNDLHQSMILLRSDFALDKGYVHPLRRGLAHEHSEHSQSPGMRFLSQGVQGRQVWSQRLFAPQRLARCAETDRRTHKGMGRHRRGMVPAHVE